MRLEDIEAGMFYLIRPKVFRMKIQALKIWIILEKIKFDSSPVLPLNFFV